MIKFIKLNEVLNATYIPLILNTNIIRHIKLGEKGKDTMIQTEGGKFFFVKESVEQIWAMLNFVDYNKAQIVTTENQDRAKANGY